MDAGIRIFGAFSRFKDQKGFSIRARERYGSATIDYPFFDTRPYTSYKSITLRAGAQDCTQSKIRDIVITDLVRETTTLDVAAYKQSVVYINGQYWGIYNIREKINKYMLAQHHNLSNPENIDLIVGDATALVGSTDNYNQMIDYVTSNEANINDGGVQDHHRLGGCGKLCRLVHCRDLVQQYRPWQHQILARENAGRQMALDLVRFSGACIIRSRMRWQG